MSTRTTRFQRLERLEPNRFPRRKKPMPETEPAAETKETAELQSRVEALEKTIESMKPVAETAEAVQTATPEVEVKDEANAVASVDESVPVEAAGPP